MPFIDFTPTPPDVDETTEDRVRRKAADFRRVFLAVGLAHSSTPDLPFENLPPHRQERWLAVARAYCRMF